jgi:predicted aspartyl protease
MDAFFHPITVLGPSGERVTVVALVDTGSTFTTLPGDVLKGLGVEPRRRVRLRLANGRANIQDLGYATVELDGLEGPTFVVFGTDGAPATIGAVTLGGFLLGVDPVEQKLIPVDGWQV